MEQIERLKAELTSTHLTPDPFLPSSAALGVCLVPDTCAGPISPQIPSENLAQRRRWQRIALIEEFGGHAANLKVVAREAMKRGMYSPRTNPGDVELCLLRTWKLRNRSYKR